jgi:hypothetical protein
VNLKVDLAWILAVAQQIPGDPQVVDYGVPIAAEARHRAEILEHEVYPEPHHKAAALLCQLARNPSLEVRNLLFAATVTAAYLAACSLPVPGHGGATGPGGSGRPAGAGGRRPAQGLDQLIAARPAVHRGVPVDQMVPRSRGRGSWSGCRRAALGHGRESLWPRLCGAEVMPGPGPSR